MDKATQDHPMFSTKSWFQRLKDAKRRGRFTYEDRLLAASFNSCAVGEGVFLRKGQKFEFGGMPPELWVLGVDFAHTIGHDEIKQAQYIYLAILKIMCDEYGPRRSRRRKNANT